MMFSSYCTETYWQKYQSFFPLLREYLPRRLPKRNGWSPKVL